MIPLSAVLLVLVLPRADAAEVRLDGGRLAELLPEERLRPVPGPAPIVVAREVTIAPLRELATAPSGSQGAVRVVVRWRVHVPRAGAAVDWVLAGPELLVEQATVDGRPGAVTADARGTVFADVLEGPAVVVELTGRVAGDLQRGVAVALMPAASGTITAPPGFVVGGAVAVGPGRYTGAHGPVSLAPAPERGTDRPTLVLGEAAVGVTIGEAEIRVGARVRFRVADGELDRVAFSVPGAGVDLAVTGPQIASWTRSGDRVEAVLLRPERSLVALDVSWSVPAPQGETAAFPVPDVRPEGVFRVASALQIARDGTVDVLPDTPDWQPVAPSLLPDWGRGLVQGTPTAAFTGRGGSGTLNLFRFIPADGPATLIDVAQYTLATTHEGRVLLRAHLAVRNDRGAALRIVPPPGLAPIGVRVGGETATVSRDGEAWIVPLAKSVETVEGLLSFPVELTLLGEVGSWAAREERSLALPVLDVEVAVTRVTVHLPPRYRSRLKPGRDGVVASFTEGSGITYGFSVGDTRAAQADVIFQSAVSAWMGNDFEQAQALLEDLGELGASNEDMTRLQSNLSLVLGEQDLKSTDDGAAATVTASAEDVLERRVKEQARARASEELLLQEEAEKKAEEAYNVGDYEEAEESYRQALEIGEKLGKLSNREDESQLQANVELKSKLDKTLSTKRAKETVATSSRSASDDQDDEPSAWPAVDLDFDDLEITGELVGPEGTSSVEESWGVGDAVTVAGGEVIRLEAPEDDELTPAAAPSEDPLTDIPVGRNFSSVVSISGKRSGVDRRVSPKPEPEPEPEPEPWDEPKPRFAVHAPPPAEASPDMPTPVLQSAPGVVAGKSSRKRSLDESDATGGKGEISVMGGGDVLAAPVVTAASLSVVVPTIGQPVHYQHLLLPPGATWSVPVRARESRRTR